MPKRNPSPGEPSWSPSKRVVLHLLSHRRTADHCIAALPEAFWLRTPASPEGRHYTQMQQHTAAFSAVQIASAVFIRPPMATCGLTEEEAVEQLAGDIHVFVSKFKPMKNTLSGREERTLMKLIVHAETDEVGCVLEAVDE